MEKKLVEYRRQKQREEFIAHTKARILELPSKIYYGLRFRTLNRHENNSNVDECNEPLLTSSCSSEKRSNLEDEVVVEHKVPSDTEIDNITCCTGSTIIKYLLIFIVWVTIFVIFIQWGFGSPYFIITSLVAMYFNTGTRKKQRGEVSAYSVFNKNCESIHGTVKAEDLEKQMIYGRLF